MTKGRFLLFLLPAVLFVLIAVPATVHAQWRSDTQLMTDDSTSAAPVGFGSLFAGSWLGEGSFGLDFDCDGVADTPPNPPFTDAHTFGAGGSYLATNPANPNGGNGTWVKTGPRQITAKNVTFINVLADVEDVEFTVVTVPTTQLNLIAIISLVVDFDRGFETATTTFGARLFLSDQDPLVDAPFLCTAGGHESFRKVNATQ